MCCISLHDNDDGGGGGGDESGSGGGCGSGDDADKVRMKSTQDCRRLDVESMANHCQPEPLGYLWSQFACGAYGIQMSFISYEVCCQIT